MVTGMQYNAEAGDRMYIPRGTTYACMTHQGVSYYWCSKKAEAGGADAYGEGGHSRLGAAEGGAGEEMLLP